VHGVFTQAQFVRDFPVRQAFRYKTRHGFFALRKKICAPSVLEVHGFHPGKRFNQVTEVLANGPDLPPMTPRGFISREFRAARRERPLRERRNERDNHQRALARSQQHHRTRFLFQFSRRDRWAGRRHRRCDRPGLYHFPRLGRRRRRMRTGLEPARSVGRVANFLASLPQKYLWATQAAKCSASASHSSAWISSRQKAQATLRPFWHFPCWLRRCRCLTQF
jgi:hypothetical protein